MLTKSKLALAVAATVGLTISAGAYATNGILQPGNGIVAQGMGGAGLSNTGEAAAGMDNPALVSKSGDALSIGWSMFSPDREVVQPVPLGGATVVSDSKLFAIPQIAFTSKLNNDISWGIMAYALGGMNTDYRTGPFGAGNPEGVNLQGMIIAPTLSYVFNNNVSVGASLLIGYENMTARNLFGGFPVVNNTFDDTAVGFGVKLGVDAKVADGISIGAMIQPQMKMDELQGFKTFLNNFSYTGDASIPLPASAGVGAKFTAGKNIDIVADILYYQWSGIEVFELFGWEDQVVYKLGLEYRPSDKLALRAGINYGESPIKGGNRTANFPGFGAADAAFANYLFPAISTTHVTLGLGYKIDKSMTIHAYYMHSPEASETTSTTSFSGPFTTPPGTTVSMTQNAFGLGINYMSK